MASTYKTKNLKLPQWELSDKPQMADFNDAFEKIDTYTANKANLDDVLLQPKEIIANTNLNNITSPGMYFCASDSIAATLQNCPLAYSFSLLVEKGAGQQAIQTIKHYRTSSSSAGKATVFIRCQYPDNWSGRWERLLTETYINTLMDTMLTQLGNIDNLSEYPTIETVLSEMSIKMNGADDQF